MGFVLQILVLCLISVVFDKNFSQTLINHYISAESLLCYSCEYVQGKNKTGSYAVEGDPDCRSDPDKSSFKECDGKCSAAQLEVFGFVQSKF